MDYCVGTVVPTDTSNELTEGDLYRKIPTHKECPHKNVSLAIEETVWRDINHMKKQMGNIEFAVLLIGKVDDAHYMVDGYYIPEQEVTSTLAEITEKVPDEIASTVIGHLHSHHRMGAFHSATDIDHFNYPINMVISDTGTKTTIRHRTPCGCLMELELNKFDLAYVTSDIDLSKIKTKQYNYQHLNQKYENYPQRYGEPAIDNWEEIQKKKESTTITSPEPEQSEMSSTTGKPSISMRKKLTMIWKNGAERFKTSWKSMKNMRELEKIR